MEMTVNRLTASYDDDVDVMYLSVGKPQPSVTKEVGNGVLLRVSKGEPTGVTILDFHDALEIDPQLIERIARHLDAPISAVERAIRAAGGS